jgi:predicted nuclease of restriction endonuclease-like RecB superfamily
VLLEIVGFRTPEYLEHKRRTLQQFRRHNILIAVPERSIRDGARIGEGTFVYKTAIKIAPLIKALERIRTENATV